MIDELGDLSCNNWHLLESEVLLQPISIITYASSIAFFLETTVADGVECV